MLNYLKSIPACRFALLAVLVGILSACSAEKSPPESAVSLGAFLELKRGTSLEEVRSELKMPGKHQFSVFVSEADCLCLYFLFDEPRVGFYLIFTNGHLKAVVDPPKLEFERVPYKNSFREIPKPVDSEKVMRTVLESADLSREEIELLIRQAVPKGKESLNVLPAFLIASALSKDRSAEIKADYQTNEELAKKFDPMKLKVGAQTGDVEKEFGKPYRVINQPGERVIHVYGSPVYLRVKPGDHFSWVTVYFENGKAVQILSDYFFDKRLLESQP